MPVQPVQEFRQARARHVWIGGRIFVPTIVVVAEVPCCVSSLSLSLLFVVGTHDACPRAGLVQLAGKETERTSNHHQQELLPQA